MGGRRRRMPSSWVPPRLNLQKKMRHVLFFGVLAYLYDPDKIFIFNFVISRFLLKSQPALWIRIDLIRIRIQAKTELSKTISFSIFLKIKI
jgi:hypothetical protein